MPSILDTSLSALTAYQGALATTSQNIANVGNDSYSRQRVQLDARLPIRQGPGFFGQGVQLTDVSRVIDDFNTISLRDSTSSTSRLSTFESYATRVENILADENGSLMPALDNFFNAMNDVANDPSANAPRVALLGATENLQQRFASLGTELQKIEKEVDGSLRVEVAEVNAIASDLAKLNGRISSISDASNRPADLLDQRDALLKQLSEKISVNVVEQSNGTLNILVGSGQLLVSNETAFTLVTQPDAAQPDLTAVAIQSNGSSVAITESLVGGNLGGLLDLRSNLLQSAQNQLGRTAIAVADSVNAQSVQGYDLNGDFGTNFFSTVSMGRLQGQFGGDYLNNGLVAGETISFDLQFDGRTVPVSYTVQVGDTNQDVANGLLFGANGIDADGNVTDNGDGTYTLAGTTTGVSMTFELYGTNIKFETAGGPSPLGNNLTITNLTDGATDNTSLILSPLGSGSTGTTAGVVSTGNPASFTGPSTVAIANSTNTGTETVNFSITDVNALTTADYEVRFDGTNYNVIRLNDNATLATGPGPFVVDGLEITPSGVAAAQTGDSYYIRATKLGAVSFQTQINDADKIAAASPIRVSANAGNIGDVSVVQLTISDALDGNLTRTVDVFFDPANPAGTFDVVDRSSGTVLQNDVAYFDGISISQNGWQLQLSGAPQPGDTVTVQNNSNAVGDNRNMLLM
ncbi:Flagellar hook-associated protein FlgK, partial [hydrothermal vent metagenome]